MGHGLVMYQRDTAASRLWAMMVEQGQFIAVYTERTVELRSDVSASQAWLSALVPTTGKPLHFPPTPDLGGNYTDYARYEPTGEGQFLQMCGSYRGPTVVLPVSATDDEALRLLGEMDAIQIKAWPWLHERFYVVRREKLRTPEKSHVCLPDLMKSIALSTAWAYFLGFWHPKDNLAVFVSDNRTDVDSLSMGLGPGQPRRKADWLASHGIIEKW